MASTVDDLWTRDDFADDDLDEVGFTFVHFKNALQCWSFMQLGRATSVAEAARVFNTSPAVVIEAVEHHPWMFLIGPTDDFTKLIIEHEGE